MIQVLIADDHQHVRRGLRRLLQQNADMQLVGEASNGQEAVTLAQELQPHVVIMDVSMPEVDGFQALARIRALGLSVPVIMLSMYGSSDFVRRAMHLGADGYVLKQNVAQQLISAIRTALQGNRYFPSISDSYG